MARIWWWKKRNVVNKMLVFIVNNLLYFECLHCCILRKIRSTSFNLHWQYILESCIDFSPTLDLFHQNAKTTVVWFSPPCSATAFSYWIILQSQKLNVGKTTTEYHQWTPSFIDLNTVCLNKFWEKFESSKKLGSPYPKLGGTPCMIYTGKYVTFCESWRNQAQFCTLWDFYDYDDGWAQWLGSPLTQAHLAKIDQLLLLKAKGGKWESLVLGSSSTSRETTLGGK